MKIEPITKITLEVLDAIQGIHNISKDELDYRDGDTFLIAKEQDLILGYSHARLSTSHILALYVLDNHRKGERRVGSSLLSDTIKTLKNKGINHIHLGVEPTNKGVIPFYEKYDFNITSVGKTGFTTLTYNVQCQNT